MASQARLGIAILVSALARAFSADPSPLQDFCIADKNSTLFINGLVCKDPKLVTPEDFFFNLNTPGNTSNPVGSFANLTTAAAFPTLNTLGMSIARIDFAPHGLNPPHMHPRASEILTVAEGTLLAGFVTTKPKFQLFLKTLKKGDVFVFPLGLIHFQLNICCKASAIAIAVLTSQNPGVITIADTVFGSNPRIPVEILEKAFQVDKKVIEKLMTPFN